MLQEFGKAGVTSRPSVPLLSQTQADRASRVPAPPAPSDSRIRCGLPQSTATYLPLHPLRTRSIARRFDCKQDFWFSAEITWRNFHHFPLEVPQTSIDCPRYERRSRTTNPPTLRPSRQSRHVKSSPKWCVTIPIPTEFFVRSKGWGERFRGSCGPRREKCMHTRPCFHEPRL